MSDAIPLPPRPHLDYYKKVAKELRDACKSDDPAAVRGWADRWIEPGAESERLARRWREFKKDDPRKARCLLADAQFFIAREHGFASWPKFAAHIEALARGSSRVSTFEAAVDAIVSGDTSSLRTLLQRDPGLVRARSTREHRSTLLHYVSANGVEDFRQKTPKNIVEITEILLKAGADVNAESEAYGGGSTALGLAATSLHPEAAGVQIPLLELLLAHGARIDESAIKGCLANGQGGAAEFFANRGVSMDLEEAAGVGRLDVVRRYFGEDGALRDNATREQMESGFLYACGYGHPAVVEFLLERGVDPGVRNKDGQTGLHWAAFGPHPAVVKLLLERGAPVDVREKAYQGTPLEWVLYLWSPSADGAERERASHVVALLVRAGAELHPQWSAQDAERRRAAEAMIQASQ